MRHLKGFVLAGSLLAALGASARADTVSYTSVYGPGTGSYTQTIQLQQFNPSLGTLTGIQIALNSTVTGSMSLFNTTGANQQVTNAAIVTPVNIVGPGSLNLSSNFGISFGNVTAAPGQTNLPTTGNATGSGSANTTLPSSSFGSYIGTGTSTVGVDVNVGNSSVSFVAPAGIFGGANSITTSGTVVITYTFTPVPEPATVAMLGVGLAGVLGVARVARRRSRVA